MPATTLTSTAAMLALAVAVRGVSQPSEHALRFFGTGVGPPGQQDRVRIPIDDNVPGSAGHTACDVGAGSFSIDLWLRGRLAENSAPGHPPGSEHFDFRWIEGNIIVDRDIWGNSSRDWGVSLGAGRVQFGTGRADSGALDSEHTLIGVSNVLDDRWRHVCLVRDASTGAKFIYVDGVLDTASPPNRSRDDISYPDAGVAQKATPWCPYIVLAAEKHDAGAAYPSYSGFLDEFRVWSIALSAAQVAATFDRAVDSATPGLVAAYRFEEGAAASLSGGPGAPVATLIAGLAGNGQWVSRAADVANTAPLRPACPADINASGGLSVQDIFDFLAWYFASNPAADFNRSGSLTVQDLFDFLAAYFQGC